MNDNEIWVDIQGFEGLYQISNQGNVKSLERTVIKSNGRKQTNKERILVPSLIQNKSGDPHLVVSLCRDGKIVAHPLVHRLVAIHFIPNPNNYDVVHHIDHNPFNNCVENLCWMKLSDHSEMHGVKIVYQYTPQGELVNTCTTNEAAKNGFRKASICRCCRGERPYHKGFVWSYTPLDASYFS